MTITELLEYYVRTPEPVASAVRKELDSIYEEDIPIVTRYILETVPATTALSVSHVVEAKRAVGAKGKRTYQAPFFRVECPVCEKEYYWSQAGNDVCPNCGYPYHETLVASEYRALGKSVFDEWEEKLIAAFRQSYMRRQK